MTACAADDEIATDRPDFVESSNVVGKGRFQIETSIAGERSNNDGVRARLLSTPTLLRIGVSDTLELRVETDGRLQSRVSVDGGPTFKTNGYADTAVGIKWHARDAVGSAPSIGVLAHLDLDSGSSPFRANGQGGSLRVVGEWDLPDGFSLGVMPGLSWQRDDNGARYTAGIFGVVLGKEISAELRGFVELSAPHIAKSGRGGSEATIDVGLAWLLAPTVQLDTAFSGGLNRQTADQALTVGLSVKF
ncbi:transporter [Massilia sp. CF038]|uniref:transporter n=1 Tax=Massilia sp. CF038 TaxID=1881045 RepID=UPI001E48D6B7|nr:transporter [Massilia sp. CF038]